MAEFEPRLAFEHLDKLAYEIGPRLAGTRGERQAAEYIRKQLEGYGYQVKVQEFRFVSRAARTRVKAVLLLAAFIASLFLSAQYSIITFVAALSLFYVVPRAMPKYGSQNIIGTIGPKKPKKHVLISAHYDSARCVVSHRLNIFLRLALPPTICAFAICLFARLLGVVAMDWRLLWAFFAPVFFPLTVGMFISTSSRHISPGANDNASGVAVMLEVARVAAGSPDEAEVTFVAFGAEEQGLEGSSAFVKGQKVVGEKIVVLNLDMLGAGKQPFIVEGNGLLRRTKTPPQLNEVLMDCCRRVGLKPRLWWASLAGHDHIPFVRAKVPATTFTIDVLGEDRLGYVLGKIFGLPNSRTRGYRYIHTIDDIPDRVTLENIERAGRVVLEFIKTAGKTL
jgi:Zn-dependent M28 family amino/carboxypeptidase